MRHDDQKKLLSKYHDVEKDLFLNLNNKISVVFNSFYKTN